MCEWVESFWIQASLDYKPRSFAWKYFLNISHAFDFDPSSTIRISWDCSTLNLILKVLILVLWVNKVMLTAAVSESVDLFSPRISIICNQMSIAVSVCLVSILFNQIVMSIAYIHRGISDLKEIISKPINM